jgi:hypothetical protein
MDVQVQAGRVGRAGAEVARAHPSWLALREPADAEARSRALVVELGRHWPAGPAVVHDLGCGTGSMGRWLAPRLPGPQHWVLHDRDAELLVHAAADSVQRAADGCTVTTETRADDITRLDPGALSGASLITASALLDMLSEDELDRLVSSCVEAGCPLLITLSVVGRVQLEPAHPLDAGVAEAFNAHQRREVGGRRLLGPDAVGAAAARFEQLGHQVRTRPSPWRLGPDHAALAAEWFAGWLDAACEQQPELVALTGEYAARRHAAAVAGRLGVTVQHQDLLAVPRPGPSRRGEP